ncbi:MAG: hypothetical protein ACREIC_04955 [Limisphaerales bacterium]
MVALIAGFWGFSGFFPVTGILGRALFFAASGLLVLSLLFSLFEESPISDEHNSAPVPLTRSAGVSPARLPGVVSPAGPPPRAPAYP